jgi:hypothetical protein
MSSRGRKNLPVGSLIFSSAEALAIRDKCCLDRRGVAFCCDALLPELAHRDVSARRINSVGIGGMADNESAPV